ncbi:LOW QUALITY PROTEIN: ectonucleotide pyrophosphatase/phosphodiesterase family member 6-like [Pomacea canaliculata]|uniref:LOW QUALITY PROTEIN: ectonucleotide pyrophosphatase/phosphodiesterase family member 6-like n=1 Tax=Pomacea canaliculata TaxID=400727 RepID=UPI000D732D36|nr:LOW QUALITY PROTEIN: ectonucleotide pyrophosphatase/phosphodiesterase family member 6-like [Pomacea canaliculata]
MSSASPKDICFFVSVVCSLACVIVFSAHAHAQETEARSAQKLLLLLLDGARHDYLDHSDTPLPGFKQVTARGVQADYLIPDFPTVSYPNYYSLMTGLHTESHGMTGNYMYDVTKKEKFLIGTNPEQFHSHWWDGGDPLWITAVRQNKTAYMYYWPGCEVQIRELRPTFCQPYKSVPDVRQFQQAVMDGLQKLQRGDADIVGVYFELLDSQGHSYGPLSRQVMDVMKNLDQIMSTLYRPSTHPRLVMSTCWCSDHGQTRVTPQRVINLVDVIETGDYEAIMGDISVVGIYPKENRENKLYEKLKNVHPNLMVYRKEDLPDRWHYKRGKYVSAITLVADPGWVILHPESRTFPTRQSDGMPKEGWHGYDNNNKDMMGLFFAMGPSFRQNVRVPPLHSVDLYQLMCYILNIQPSPNNGSWPRVAEALTSVTSRCMTSVYWTVFLLALVFELSHSWDMI